MRTFLRILAVLVAIPTILLLLAGLVLLDLRITLLNPAFTERVLRQQEVYERFPGLVTTVMFEQMTQTPVGVEEGGAPAEPSEGLTGAEIAAELEGKFGRQALEDLVAALLPPTWMQQQAEYNIETLFAWLNSDEACPDLRLDLSDVGERLSGSEGRAAFGDLLAHLPPCQPGTEMFDAEGVLPRCQPSDEELDDLLADNMPQIQAQLPPDVSLCASVTAANLQGLDGVRQGFRSLGQISLAVWLGSLILLGLILLLAARGLGGVLRWAGWPLLIAGGLGGIGMAVAWASVPALVEMGITQLPAEPPIPPQVLDLVRALIHGLLGGVTGVGLALVLGLALLGLLAVVLGAVLRRRPAPVEPLQHPQADQDPHHDEHASGEPQEQPGGDQPG
jgi:hypothetical protein